MLSYCVGLLLGPSTQLPAQQASPKNGAATAAVAGRDEDGFQEPRTTSGWMSVEPFDRITLNNENRGMVLYCLPLDLPERKPPELPRRTGTLKLNRIDEPGQLYELDWVAVVRVDLFEQLLLSEAQRLTEAREFYQAFQFFSRLFADYPRTPGLAEAYEKYLQADALAAFRAGRYDAALISLSELTQRKTGTKEEVDGALRRVIERVLEETFKQGRYEVVHQQLQQFKRRFGTSVQATVAAWEKRLQDRAVEQVQAAERLGPEQAVQQRMLCQAAQRAWPQVPGAAEILERIFAANAVLRVGVQTGEVEPQANHVANWAAQRVASLVQRPLVEIRDFAAEGVVCQSRLGEFRILEDRSGWTLTLAPSSQVDAFGVFQGLASKLQPDSPELEAWLAGQVKQVYPVDRRVLELRWRHPQVESLALFNTALQLPIAQASPLLSPYVASSSPTGHASTAENVGRVSAEANSSDLLSAGPQASSAEDSSAESSITGGREFAYQRREFVTGGPASVVEVQLGSPQSWEDRWLQGDIDMIDRLRPIERDAAANWPEARVVRYRFPSQHWLMVNREKSVWESKELRRALLYGIDRQRILQGVFLGAAEHAGCLVTSGPCPAGWTRDDPLAYGYLTNLAPRPYDPILAKVLLQLHVAQANRPLESAQPAAANSVVPTSAATNSTATTGAQGATVADGSQEEQGETSKPAGNAAEGAARTAPKAAPALSIVLAYPEDYLIKQACEEIAAAWESLGATCKLRPLPAGHVVPSDEDWDLLYVDARIRDPLTDIHRLFGPNGQLPSPGPYVRTMEQQLNQVSEWAELRASMLRLQQFAYDDVAILPLWQVVDYGLVRARLSGVSDNLVGLYDGVETWQWAPARAGGAQP